MSVDLSQLENGHPVPKAVVFDAPAEDAPLLREPLLFNFPSSPLPASIPEHAPPPRSSPTRGAFTQGKQEVQKQKKRVVHYDSDSHLRVLFQMYGSVWPSVLPYCLVAVAVTYLIYYLQNHKIVDLTFSTSNGTCVDADFQFRIFRSLC